MTDAPRAIAFYLPQFHPIPENDLWWGTGFTEWRNVAKAQSLFPGHYQPHIPANLGFYDLRLPEARIAQAQLAKAYGIHGFCYWHYWFNGKRVLERPFEEVLKSGEPDFPFCLAWANENWTRRWDGEDQEVLLYQGYSLEDDKAHIRSLLPAFNDPRYITINGKPLFLVYRVNSFPDPAATARLWRDEAVKAGLPGLYLCTVTSLPELNFDPKLIGFDAAVDFQPAWGDLPCREIPRSPKNLFSFLKKQKPVNPAYATNAVRSYRAVVENMMIRPRPEFKLFPGVTPGWDNSPRRKADACIFTDSEPETYGRWLRHAVSESLRRFEGEEKLVFINAWNEWAEGNHLEPDLKWGLRYLEETWNAVRFDTVLPESVSGFRVG